MKEAIFLRLYLLVITGILFPFYRLALLLRLVRIKGWDPRKFWPGENGLVTISNHVTKLETVIIPLSLFPFFLIWLRLLPFTVAKKKWWSKPWFAIVRPAAILVCPGEGIGAEESMKPVISSLKRGKIVHLYPEGKRMKYIEEEKQEVRTLGKRKIGRFYPGALVAILGAKSDLLGIWNEWGRWPRQPLLTTTYGERVPFSSLNFPDKKFSELTPEEREKRSTQLQDVVLEA